MNEPETTKSALIQMTPQQRVKANRLIRRLCANYSDGECVALDCICPQSISYTLLCKYFRQAVLPAEPILEAEILKKKPELTCSVCGVPIRKTGNRRKYCKCCARARYLQAKAKYQRKVRSGVE